MEKNDNIISNIEASFNMEDLYLDNNVKACITNYLNGVITKEEAYNIMNVENNIKFLR